MVLVLAAAGCGAASRSGSEQTEKPPPAPVAQELPCEQLPEEANCPGPTPARPVPMSPDGPVRSFKSEYLDSQVMITTNGVFGVAATAPRTFALTGTVADSRLLPVEGATVTFSNVSGPNLPAPPGGDVRVTTKSGYDGAFAVINLPAASSGTCYRMMIDAPHVGWYESVDVLDPGVYNQSIELDGGLQIEDPLLPLAGPGRGSSLERACAESARAAD